VAETAETGRNGPNWVYALAFWGVSWPVAGWLCHQIKF